MHSTLTERPVARAPRPRRPMQFVPAWVALAAVALALVGLGVYFSMRARGAPAGSIDAPADGAVLASVADVSGWAIDQAAYGNTGVDRVQLYVDGTYFTDAAYGLGRADIGSSFGLQFAASGWSARIDPQGLSSGRHTLEARAHSVLSGQDTRYSRAIVVPQGTAPNGSLDEPKDGVAIDGTFDVRGWAIDQRANEGTGIDRVQLYVDGSLRSDTSYGQSRPDVAASYGAQFDGSGWTARLDPQGLSLGQHTLEARARSALTSQEASYTAHVVLQQATAPRGSVDTPEDGATVSGVLDAAGWAIDESASDGTGIDRVRLYLDDELVGEATYGMDRPEIGSAYGARFGPSGWTAQVDLASVAAGKHTLEVRVHSALTGAETTYSRALTVQP